MADFPPNPGELKAAKLCNKFPPFNPIKGDGPLTTHDAREDLVKHLQSMLRDLGFALGDTGEKHDGVDGDFGKLTSDAVVEFQKSHKDWDDNPLAVDKLVGPESSDALNREMVGRWYDLYQTPKELTVDHILITATTDAVKDKVPIDPKDMKNAKIVVVGKLPARSGGLIGEVKKVCDRLASTSPGWKELLLHHGLDISAIDLRKELEKELASIDRSLVGFEDFAVEGKRGIEPGDPACSLFYHAIASPNVVKGVDGSDLPFFPTLADIEIVENYVFGAKPPKISDLKAKAGGKLGIVVFASEYRPSAEAVHRKHADLCFSRTAVARVGTLEALYDAKNRGFLPFDIHDPHAIRILPSRYSVYLAVHLRGDESKFGPLRIRPNDDSLFFWVPIHKLFSGPECIDGLDLNVTTRAHHVNEKILRIHSKFKAAGLDSGFGATDDELSKSPFKFDKGIADWSSDSDLGTGVLMPVVHPKLVEPAEFKGKPLTLKVPRTKEPPAAKGFNTFSSSLAIDAEKDSRDYAIWRNAPEYVYVRDKLSPGHPEDLNKNSEVEDIVGQGNYNSRLFLDFAGDGVIDALCPELKDLISAPAYSIITAPDFFPNCDQIEVVEFWEKLRKLVPEMGSTMWAQGGPDALSDERTLPNLQIDNAGFDKGNDDTITAIFSLLKHSSAKETTLDVQPTTRHSYLPDAASGIHAPGWDVGFDHTLSPTNPSKVSPDLNHLSAYGLGSPFPEDAKLCASLGTFWPAVSPDATRTFEPRRIASSDIEDVSRATYTVAPLTDEEIGITGKLSWDGVTGPKIVKVGHDEVVEYFDLEHTDYVQNALNSKFSLKLTGKIDAHEYKARLLAMAKVYQALGAKGTDINKIKFEKARWAVLSFTKLEGSRDSALIQAKAETGSDLKGTIYNFKIFRHGKQEKHPSDVAKLHVEIIELQNIFIGIDSVDPLFYKDNTIPVLLRREDSKAAGEGWKKRNV